MKFLNFYWSIIWNIIFKKFIKVYEILIFLKIYIILNKLNHLIRIEKVSKIRPSDMKSFWFRSLVI